MSSMLQKLGLEFHPFEPFGSGSPIGSDLVFADELATRMRHLIDRHQTEALLVDEFTAELGERAGLACREIRAVRWGGNSAQQMGRYGRVASRESVVLFEKQRPVPLR